MYEVQELRNGEWRTYETFDDGIQAARVAIKLSGRSATRVIDETGEVLAQYRAPLSLVPYARSDG